MFDVIIQCPHCDEDFTLQDNNMVDVAEVKEIKSFKRPKGREKIKHQIKVLLLKATDDRTPIHERQTACRVAEGLMRKNKVKLGEGMDKEILSFQFYRGFLKGFERAELKRIEA